MTKSVLIHAGAHRTGTSSFQLCLHENRAVLDRYGYDIAYPGRDGVAGGNLRLPLPRRRHGEKRIPQYAARARSVLMGLSPDAGRGLVLSEENIPGPMLHFYHGQFFPASRKRFLSLAGALEAAPVHVLYVVRSYAEMFVSAYRKRAEDNPVAPFAEIVPTCATSAESLTSRAADLIASTTVVVSCSKLLNLSVVRTHLCCL